MKIYTKKGDAGTTQLIGGSRVPKDHIRIDAYGTIDELNSTIGALKDSIEQKEIISFLKYLQDRLFMIGSVLACDAEGSKMILPDIETSDIEKIEQSIDEMSKDLPELKNFILPGGYMPASWGHIARCICRRAERNIVALDHMEKVDEIILVFLNRLSDYFFVLSRYLTFHAKKEEIIWAPRNA